MSAAVLDASAVLALLKGEPGGAKVAGVLAEAMISVVNLTEVISHFAHLGMPVGEIENMLGALPLTLVAADAALAWEAGRLRIVTSQAGLSLGDRYCLAVAKRESLPAWTADKAWKSIAAAAGVKVTMIR
jgi:ribonuclease VapC